MIHLRWYKMWRFVFALGLTISFDLGLVNQVNGDADVVEVDIESGRVRGKRGLTLFREKPYYSFRGIPYAQPPIKDLRFKVSIIYNRSPSQFRKIRNLNLVTVRCSTTKRAYTRLNT